MMCFTSYKQLRNELDTTLRKKDISILLHINESYVSIIVGLGLKMSYLLRAFFFIYNFHHKTNERSDIGVST